MSSSILKTPCGADNAAPAFGARWAVRVFASYMYMYLLIYLSTGCLGIGGKRVLHRRTLASRIIFPAKRLNFAQQNHIFETNNRYCGALTGTAADPKETFLGAHTSHVSNWVRNGQIRKAWKTKHDGKQKGTTEKHIIAEGCSCLGYI